MGALVLRFDCVVDQTSLVSITSGSSVLMLGVVNTNPRRSRRRDTVGVASVLALAFRARSRREGAGECSPRAVSRG